MDHFKQVELNNVVGSIIVWYTKSRGITQVDLAEHLSARHGRQITQPDISKAYHCIDTTYQFLVARALGYVSFPALWADAWDCLSSLVNTGQVKDKHKSPLRLVG